MQPIAAAVFAWILLGESFGLQQVVGGAIVMAGILLCRFAMPAVPAGGIRETGLRDS